MYSTGSHRKHQDRYCFTDVEVFPADFEMMHLAIMASPRWRWQRQVMAVRLVYEEQTGDGQGCVPLVGHVIMIGDQLVRSRHHLVVKKMKLNRGAGEGLCAEGRLQDGHSRGQAVRHFGPAGRDTSIRGEETHDEAGLAETD
jgi:hypothetical protein